MQERGYIGNPKVVGNPVVHYIKFMVYMYVFWLLMTANTEPKFLIMGAIGTVVVTWLCMPLFMFRNHDRSKLYFMLGFSEIKLVLYFFWLIKELILANIDVAKASVAKDLPIEPQVLRFQCHFDNPVALTILANSITLTPGTITMEITKSNVYVIHALTPGAAEGIIGGSMLRKVADLFNESPQFEMLEGGEE